MSAFIDLMYRGGPFMYPILLGFLGGGVLALVRALLSGRARFVGLGAATLLGLISLGLAGTFSGFIQVFDAIVHASPETKQALFEAGTDVALVTVKVAAFCALILAPLHLIAALRESAEPPRGLKLGALGLSGLLLLIVLLDLGVLAAYFATVDGFSEAWALETQEPSEIVATAARISQLMYTGAGLSLGGFVLSLLLGVVSLATGGMSMASKESA